MRKFQADKYFQIGAYFLLVPGLELDSCKFYGSYIFWLFDRLLTCQRFIFRLIGLPLGKNVTSQRNRNAPDVVTRRYGNGNMAEHTTTWPPEFASHMLL
jgi:hypothetical protein